MVSNIIADEEDLYRSVRADIVYKEYIIENNVLSITHRAFKDKNKQPSVDRALLRNSPTESKLSPTDGIVKLLTHEVRCIDDVCTNDQQHIVDVVYKPIKNNDHINEAHSQVDVKPEFFGSRSKQDTVFERLRISLAKIATNYGWVIPPSH